MKKLIMFLIVGVLGYVFPMWTIGEDFDFLTGLLFSLFFMVIFGIWYLGRKRIYNNLIAPFKGTKSWSERIIMGIIIIILAGGIVLLRLWLGGDI